MAGKKEDTTSSSLPISTMLKRGEIRILVVEDDKFLRELLVGKLKKEGYVTSEALDGEEGMKIAKEQAPHLIILDLVLPGADGFTILTSFKTVPETAKIPVIVLSNLGSREDIDRALGLGAREFMVKAHHTPQEIVDTIKKVLEDTYLQK